MSLDADLQATSARLSERTEELADRMLIARKFAAEHARRSFGQRHRQTCERVARIFQELESKWKST